MFTFYLSTFLNLYFITYTCVKELNQHFHIYQSIWLVFGAHSDIIKIIYFSFVTFFYII